MSNIARIRGGHTGLRDKVLTPVQAQEYTIGPLCIKHQLLSWYDLLQAPFERREKMSSTPASWKLSKKVSSIFF